MPAPGRHLLDGRASHLSNPLSFRVKQIASKHFLNQFPVVQVQGFYTEETVTFKYKRPVKVWALHMSGIQAVPQC